MKFSAAVSFLCLATASAFAPNAANTRVSRMVERRERWSNVWQAGAFVTMSTMRQVFVEPNDPDLDDFIVISRW